MQATLPVQVVIQLGKMLIHFRELHTGICCQHQINRQTALDHQQEHGRAVLSAGQGNHIRGMFHHSSSSGAPMSGSISR